MDRMRASLFIDGKPVWGSKVLSYEVSLLHVSRYVTFSTDQETVAGTGEIVGWGGYKLTPIRLRRPRKQKKRMKKMADYVFRKLLA